MVKQAQGYQQKKAFFAKVITVYGRKPALEVLRDHSLEIYRVHLASSNKPGAELAEIEELAGQRAIDIKTHSRAELARISRNSRQDQGVAVDVMCRALTQFNEWYDAWTSQQQRVVLIALDGVSNSQNLGMIIRSCCAAGVDGILLPAKG
ncbi:MAG: RNA methyltransferase substrate-binding domain-containing protein, partial [Pseudomonadales bacterium]